MADWIAQPSPVGTGDPVPSVGFNKHSQGITHVKERWDRAMSLTGATDAAVGDLLVLDPSVTDGVALASTQGEAGPILVALEILDAGGVAGQVRAGGFVTINISDDVAKGDLVRVSSTGLGEPTIDASEAFGIATSGDTAPGQVSILMTGGSSAGGGGGGGSSNAAWDPYGLAVVPVAAAFSVHNNWSVAGILTHLDQNADNLVLYNPASVSAVQQRGIFIPSLSAELTPPYTVRACMTPQFPEIDTWAFLLVLRNSSDDKRISIDIHRDGTHFAANSVLFTSATAFSGSPGTDLDLTQGFPLWVQLRDDATNFFFEISRNGKDYQIVDSGSTGLHTTPDQAGITTDSYGGGSGGAGAVTLLSWEIL